jgi:hypothetical protein
MAAVKGESGGGAYDPIHDWVDSPSYRGPCRRVSPKHEREAYVRTHPEAVRRQADNGNGHWLGLLPKPVLVGVAMLLATAVVWLDLDWRQSKTRDIEGVRGEIKEMRKDQLEFFKLQAQEFGYPAWSKHFDSRLKQMEQDRLAAEKEK